MEENKKFGQEIIETYRQNDPREVVEVYSRPLPGQDLKQVEMSAAPERRKKRKKGLVIFLICFAVVVGLAIVAGVLAYWNNGFGARQSEKNPDGEQADTVEEITIPTHPFGEGVTMSVIQERGDALTAQEIYQRVNPAVVTVMVGVDNGMGVGAGVIFTADGYVITNYHVLAKGRECMIATANGSTYLAKYVAGDAGNDLAILKIDTENEADAQVFPYAEFGDSDLLTVGDKVYAIGNPLGVELRGTLTDGIVSAINRDVWVDNRTMTLIQTNAALNTGNSGGPLINEYGQVVGINVIKMTSRYNSVEGLGFAIPSTYMERIINDLLAWGELQPESVLGITVWQDGVQLEDGRWGLEVIEIIPDLPGSDAGVQVGDVLLTADGVELKTSQDLLRIRRQHHLGEEMLLTLWRDGEILEVTLQLDDAAEETEDTAPWYVEP